MTHNVGARPQKDWLNKYILWVSYGFLLCEKCMKRCARGTRRSKLDPTKPVFFSYRGPNAAEWFWIFR